MSEKLAIYGGSKAKTNPNFPIYPIRHIFEIYCEKDETI